MLTYGVMKCLLCILAFLLASSALQAQAITNFIPKNGRENTEVTITGTGFSGTVQVAFGESSLVAATVNSPTEIIANVPADATEGKVKVRVGGSEVQSKGVFRYVSVSCFLPNPARLSEEMIFQGTGFARRFGVLGPIAHFVVTFGSSCTARGPVIDGRVAKIVVPSCAQSGDISVKVSPNADEDEPDYRSYRFDLPDFVVAPQDEAFINSFSPTSARVGEAIKITGTGFLATARENEVAFGGDEFNAQTGSYSAPLVKEENKVQILTAYVSALSTNGKIRLKVNEKTTESPADFTLLLHTAESFSPSAFRPEYEVTVRGTNFARVIPAAGPRTKATNHNQVCFADDKCVVAAVNGNGTKLTAKVPENIPETGTIKVKIGEREVEVPGGAYTLRPVAPLTFTDFQPKQVRIGETVTLIGTGFEPAPKRNTIAIDDQYNTNTFVEAYEVNEDQTQMKVRIGSNIRGYNREINKIMVRKCTAKCNTINSKKYQQEILEGLSVTSLEEDLSITGFSPEKASYGDEITILGTGFSVYAPHARVQFGNAPSLTTPRAHDVNEDGTELKVRINSSARSGKITVFYYSPVPAWQTVSSKSFKLRKVRPVVNSITPTSGGPGTEVTITGENFPPVAEYNEVSFAYVGNALDIFATAHSVNEAGTELKARVGESVLDVDDSQELPPDGLPVAVRIVGNQVSNPGAKFIFSSDNIPTVSIVPFISNFSPDRAEINSEITISGQNFTEPAKENSVIFGGDVVATPSSGSTTFLMVRVPQGAKTGPVSVSNSLGRGTSSTEFVVSRPLVSGFSPESASVGASITVLGSGFSVVREDNIITFSEGAKATPSEATASSLKVAVPACAVTGPVSVAVNNHTGTSRKSFNVLGTRPVPLIVPFVSSFSPFPGTKPGVAVTILGVYFSDIASENIVKFGGGVVATVKKATNNSIETTVPPYARTGRITVTVNGRTGVSMTDFVVPGTEPSPPPDPDTGRFPPIIDKFTPTRGGPGIQVLIQGRNFAGNHSKNTVLFGGNLRATTNRRKEDFLSVTVPEGARTGRISISVDGQTGISKRDFTVPGTDPAPLSPVVESFAPTMGKPGTSVTIKGQGFSSKAAENKVTFAGGAVATPSLSTATSLTVKVPEGARTGRITVTANRLTGTSNINFTVPGTAPALPSIFSVIPKTKDAALRVYPNPSSQEIRFTNLAAARTYAYRVYSLIGQKVMAGRLQDSYAVQLGALSAGEYILVLLEKDSGEIFRTRLLVFK